MTTEQQELAERVRSYVKHQVSKGPDAMRDVVQKGHEQVMGLLDGMSEEEAAFKPAPEEWSTLEVLGHVLQAKRRTAQLCAELAKGNPSPIRPQDVDSGRVDVASLAEAKALLEEAHRQVIAVIDAVSPETDRDTTFEHFIFGELNCEEWAVFQRVHDGDHAQQIEQIKASPAYPGGA
jgi:hypothetical protein